MNVLYTTIKRQRSFSSTRREGFLLVCKRIFWSVFYIFKGIRLGIRGIRTEQIGSTVIHEGQRRFISNWANSPFPTLCGDNFYLQNVPREDIKNVLDAKEILHRFYFMFDWYMVYWHDIDVHKRLFQ